MVRGFHGSSVKRGYEAQGCECSGTDFPAFSSFPCPKYPLREQSNILQGPYFPADEPRPQVRQCRFHTRYFRRIVFPVTFDNRVSPDHNFAVVTSTTEQSWGSGVPSIAKVCQDSRGTCKVSCSSQDRTSTSPCKDSNEHPIQRFSLFAKLATPVAIRHSRIFSPRFVRLRK